MLSGSSRDASPEPDSTSSALPTVRSRVTVGVASFEWPTFQALRVICWTMSSRTMCVIGTCGLMKVVRSSRSSV